MIEIGWLDLGAALVYSVTCVPSLDSACALCAAGDSRLKSFLLHWKDQSCSVCTDIKNTHLAAPQLPWAARRAGTHLEEMWHL